MFISAMVLVAWIGVQFGSRLVHVELTGRGSWNRYKTAENIWKFTY